jgi:hypothetical protein
LQLIIDGIRLQKAKKELIKMIDKFNRNVPPPLGK